mmetsp:Transcript_28613/g.47357  ORF Transcript_28613/g.47357 Transcript_28613/m.47357 type:complete len:834 (-) Transcript_28613:8-2509(-)
MIERALWESLSSGVGTQIGGETERLHNWKVGKEGHLRGSWFLLLRVNVTATAGKNTVDVTHSILWNRDTAKVDRLQETWFSAHHGRKADTTSGRHDLSHTTMDSIGVKHDIHKVETARTHLFVTERSVLGGPSESTDDGFLDLEQVVDSLSGVNEKIRTSSLRTESPNLTGFRDIPAVGIGKFTSLELGVCARLDLLVVNCDTELRADWLGLEEDTVVLVSRLGEASFLGLGLKSFTEGNNWFGDLDLSSHEIVLEILEANLQMELTGSGNNVLTGLFGVAQDHRIGLGKTLHTLNELWKISRVLWLDGTTDNWGDGKLHGNNSACILLSGNSTGLEEVLVDTDKGAGVTSRDISDLLGVTTHHDDSTLDVLDPKLRLLSRNVVWSHDTDLLAGSNGSGEHTSEGVETSLIGGRDHLRDVHTERGTWASVALTDGGCGLVVQRTIVKGVDTVFLCLGWGRKVKNNHLQNSVSSREPLLHDTLEQLLANEFLLLSLELNTDGLKHLLDLSVLLSHDGLEKSGNWGGNELTESTLEGTVLVGSGPDLTGGIEIPVTPELLVHLLLRDSELGTVGLGETLEGESPLVKTRSEGNSSLRRVDLNITKCLVVVGRNNHVDGLNGTAESLVKLLSRKLQFEEGTVNLVNHETRLDTLGNSLTKNGLGLDAHTIDGINDDKSTISHTKGGSDLRRKVNVTRRVDKVDKVRVLGNLDVGVGVQLVLEGSILVSKFLISHGSGSLTRLQVVLEKHGDSGRLDGNTTLGLIGTSIGVTSSTGGLGRDNTSLLDKGVGKSGLSVVHMGNHRHRTDVVLEIHDGSHLINGKINHLDRFRLVYVET